MVFLNRASLKAKARKPLDADEYMEHDKTAANEIASRLERATVAIANKVPRRADLVAGSNFCEPIHGGDRPPGRVRRGRFGNRIYTTVRGRL